MRAPLLAAALLAGCAAAEAPGSRGAPRPEPLPEPPALVAPRLEAFGRGIDEAFDEARAMETVRLLDRRFRVRGNLGYEEALDHVRQGLAEAGFGEAEVRVLELGPERESWTPVSARLELLGPEGPETLHAFSDESEPDRGTLLVGSTFTAETELEVVEAGSGEDVRGRLVLGRGRPGPLAREAVVAGGAAGVLTLYLDEVHDPERYPDAAQFGYLGDLGGRPAIGFSLSPRAAGRLGEALAAGGGRARVRVAVDVKVGRSRATTVELRIPGERADAAVVVLVAHVDEPGAHDNASGAAAQLELARAIAAGLASGALPPLDGPIVMLWGEEIESSREWVALEELPVRAALVLDMVGASPEVVGAPLLVERLPDPATVWPRPPDEPSGWGSGPTAVPAAPGHFLSDYLLASVSLRAAEEPGWRTRSHPFEGGSDHVAFLERGLPAVLAWHFPDPAYHTTLDRADRVSGDEMRRVAAAVGAVAVGLAASTDEDGAERLSAVDRAAHLRLAQVLAASEGRPDPELERRIAEAWLAWYDEALASVADGPDDPITPHVAAARERFGEAGRSLLALLGR